MFEKNFVLCYHRQHIQKKGVMGMFTTKRITLAALVCLLVLAVVGCSAGKANSSVAATVNGVEISMDKFDNLVNKMKANYEAQGFDFSGSQGAANLQHVRKEAIDTLVQQEAIVQEARSLEYEITQEEIDEEYELIKGDFPSKKEFLNALKFNGLTEDEFKEMISEELLIAKFLENEIEEVEVTEEEIKEVYEDYVSDIEAYNEDIEDEEKKIDIPSYDELEDDIRGFIKEGKQYEQISKLIENIVEKSNIEIFI